jgi:hypothetical protein
MEEYVSTDKSLDVQFQSFYSKLDILMYYVAVSNYSGVTGTDCKQYVSHIVFIMFIYYSKAYFDFFIWLSTYTGTLVILPPLILDPHLLSSNFQKSCSVNVNFSLNQLPSSLIAKI